MPVKPDRIPLQPLNRASQFIARRSGAFEDRSLAGPYDNARSKAGGRARKARFAPLPTVDHLNDGLGPPAFKICSWRASDAKHDLTLGDFLELCEKVIRHSGGSVRQNNTTTLD